MSATTDRSYNVLFLCSGNSARSIIAEAILNHMAAAAGSPARFHAFSAGSHPKGAVHPLALAILQRQQLPTAGLRSKSWDEFAQPGTPVMNFVFTVCDQAAAEVCPIWPGHPLTAHWGIPDPAAVSGSEFERIQAFRDTFRVLETRIRLFASLPLATLDRLRLIGELKRIGSVQAHEPSAE